MINQEIRIIDSYRHVRNISEVELKRHFAQRFCVSPGSSGIKVAYINTNVLLKRAKDSDAGYHNVTLGVYGSDKALLMHSLLH